MLDLNNIKKAYKRVLGVVYRTLFSYASILSEMSSYEVYLKKENLQRTGHLNSEVLLIMMYE